MINLSKVQLAILQYGFFIIILISFIFHCSKREIHFQENDSFNVYRNIKTFPAGALSYADWSYKSTERISPIVNKLVKVKKIKSLFDSQVQKLNITSQQIIEQKWSLTRFIRTIYIKTIGLFQLPHPIHCMFSVPLSSTYSAGHGLFYGLITNPKDDYYAFNSKCTLMTILLFHLSVILIALTCYNIGISFQTILLLSITLLCSISAYSYGYHLGSTIWNIFTTSLFLWFLTIGSPGMKKSRSIAWLSGILVFFNYLIIFPYAAYLITLYISQEVKKTEFSYNTFILIFKSQVPAIISIILCTILFFQPGVGNHGNYFSFKSFYFVILNYFSMYNKAPWLDFAQFLIIAVIMLYAVKSYFGLGSNFKKIKTEIKKNIEIISTFIIMIIFSILISLAIKIYLNHLWLRLYEIILFVIFFILTYSLVKNKFIKPMKYSFSNLYWSYSGIILSIYFLIAGFLQPYFSYKIFLGAVLILVSLLYYEIIHLRKINKRLQNHHILRYVIFFLFYCYAIALSIGVLGFSPSRHIFFLLPSIYIIFSFGLDRLLKNFSFKNFLLLYSIILILGSISVNHRYMSTLDTTIHISIPEDINYIMLGDGWNPYGNPCLKEDIEIVSDLNNKKYLGKKIMYLSMTQPLEANYRFIDFLNKNNKHRIKINSFDEDKTDTYFLAYNPYNFSHNRPNNIFKAQFEIL